MEDLQIERKEKQTNKEKMEDDINFGELNNQGTYQDL